MARSYVRDSKGRFAKHPGGSAAASALKAAGRFSGAVQNVSGGGTISREEAARRMFGGATKAASSAAGRVQHVNAAGKVVGSVSRAQAAAIMFGSKEAARKLPSSTKKRKR